MKDELIEQMRHDLADTRKLLSLYRNACTQIYIARNITKSESELFKALNHIDNFFNTDTN